MVRVAGPSAGVGRCRAVGRGGYHGHSIHYGLVAEVGEDSLRIEDPAPFTVEDSSDAFDPGLRPVLVRTPGESLPHLPEDAGRGPALPEPGNGLLGSDPIR